MGSPRQVLWLPRGYGLAASRCGRPRPSSFPPRVGGTTQGAFSCGGERPSSHLCAAPGCTSVCALKNPEAVGWFSPSGGGGRAAQGASRRVALQWDPVSSSSGRFRGGFAAGAAPKMLAERSGQVPGGLGYPHSAGGTRWMKYPRCLSNVFRLGKPSPALSPFPE